MTVDLLAGQKLQVLLPDGSSLFLEHTPERLTVERWVDGNLDILVNIPLNDQSHTARPSGSGSDTKGPDATPSH